MSAWICLALAHNKIGHLYAIDDYSGEYVSDATASSKAIFLSSLTAAGLEKYATLLIGRSADVVWPRAIDIGVLDGSHDRDVVKFEISKLVQHGARCIMLHDIESHEGCRHSWDEFKQSHPDWHQLELGYSCGFGIAVEPTLP